MPGLVERYERMGEGEQGGEEQPVRNAIAEPGQEIVTLRYWQVQKGSYDAFFQASVEGVWPYFEKIGARVVGQWKVIYPPPPACERKEHPDYDEILMMTRYASYRHWKATRNAVDLGGNGPDYEKLQEVKALRQSLSLKTSVQFLQGYMYHSPPTYLPGLGERYRRVEG